MPVISLQGGMASGKTTVAHYIKTHMPEVSVQYENPKPILQQVKSLGLDKYSKDGFVQIQRLFIRAETERFRSFCAKSRSVLDLGPEEIEFYTLHFPRSIGMGWDVERLLEEDLAALRECMPDGILFLDAGVDTLRARKEADVSRARNFFAHYIGAMHEWKRDWFQTRRPAEFLPTDGMTAGEAGEEALKRLRQMFDIL